MGARGPVPKGGGAAAAASADLPKAPTGTPAAVRKMFKAIVVGNPHLTAGDSLMILQYAQAIVLQQIALSELLNEGITILDTTHGDGTEKRRHPNVITWRTACEVARAAAMRLGVAPLDRMRVVSLDDGEMDLAEMLFQNVANDQ